MAIGPNGEVVSGLGASGGYSGLSGGSLAMSVAGMLMGAVGSFYDAQSQQNAMRSQALSADFEASIAHQNAKAAELDAEAILEAGQHERALLGLQAAQRRGDRAAEAAASGLQAGVGSAAEVDASNEFAYQLDRMTARANTIRAAGAARTQAQDARNQAELARLSGRNLRRNAGSISPGLAAATSLLSGAGRVSSQWASNMRR